MLVDNTVKHGLMFHAVRSDSHSQAPSLGCLAAKNHSLRVLLTHRLHSVIQQPLSGLMHFRQAFSDIAQGSAKSIAAFSYGVCCVVSAADPQKA